MGRKVGRLLPVGLHSRTMAPDHSAGGPRPTNWALKSGSGSRAHLAQSQACCREQSRCVRGLTCRGCSTAFWGSLFTLLLGWLVILVTGCLKMDAVCLTGRAVFRSGFPCGDGMGQVLRGPSCQ